MKLETETGRPIVSPDDRAILKALGEFEEFAILGPDDLTYIQTSRIDDERFNLEYQDGDTDRHFQCPRPVSLAELGRAFLSYAQGTNEWKMLVPWERIEL